MRNGEGDCFEYITEKLTRPTKDIVELFTNFRFFNSYKSYIISKQNHFFSAREFLNSEWKIGYLKKVFKLPLRYDKFVTMLHYFSGNKE